MNADLARRPLALAFRRPRIRLMPTQRTLVVLAAQLILAQLAPLLSGLVVARQIAGFGGDAFAAYMIVSTINNTAFLAASGLLQSLFPIGGGALGRGDPEAFDAAMAAGLRWTVWLALGCMAVSALIGPLLALVGVEPGLTALAGRLGLVAAIGPGPLLYVMLFRIRASLKGRAASVTRLYLAGAAVSCAMALAVATLVEGDAARRVLLLASALAGLNLLLAATAALISRRHLTARVDRDVVKAAVRLVWRMGWPVATVILLDTLVSAASTVIVARFWPAAVPAHGTVLLWVAVGLVVPLGVSQATMQVVAMAHGRGDHISRNLAARTAVALAAGFSLIAGLVLAGNPVTLGGLLLGAAPDATAADAFARLMWLGAVVLALQSVVIVGASSLRAVGMAKAPLVWAAVGYLGGGIGGALFFSRVLDLGVTGVWIGLVTGFALAAAGVLYQLATTFGPPRPVPAA